MRPMRCILCLFAAACVWWAGPHAAPLHAQVVRGELVDRVTQQPLTRGFLVLIDANDNELVRGRVDRAGAFRLVAPGPGIYRIKTQIIGIKSTVSEPMVLEPGQILDYRFEITFAFVVLPAIVIEDVRTCRTPAEAGLAAATLWEEARKALSAVAWTEDQALLRHKLVLYERERDPLSLDIRDERREERTGLYRGSSFAYTGSGDLSEKGYIQPGVGEDAHYFYGPDAQVLLSDGFSNQHCFRPRPGLDDAALVGLSFEPIVGREVTDIQGTLWIDRHTFELRFLEFNYTKLPWDVDRGRVGGRVEFERLPDGPWIVTRWWLRMPEVGYRPMRASSDPDYWVQYEIFAIMEVGGWVEEIYGRSGTPVPRVVGSTVVGRVTAADSNVALAGTAVVLRGTEYESVVDESGRYRIDGVPEGKYFVSLTDVVLDSLGYVPPLLELSITTRRSFEVNLRVPTAAQAWPLVCGDTGPARSGVSAVTGFVIDQTSGAPVDDARVILSGSRTIMSGESLQEVPVRLEGITNEAGYYRICGVPVGVSLTAAAAKRNRSSVETPTLLSGSAVSRLDLMIRPE